MIDFTANHFEELCGSEPVRERIGTIEEKRRAALKKFWTYLPAGLAVAAAALWSLFSSGWETSAIIVSTLLAIAAVVIAISPIMGVIEDLKHPVLETLGERAGLEYIPEGFSPPVYQSARRVLFGGSLSSETFTDLFHGADEEGRGIAIYEANLQRRMGRNTYTVFCGQIYALQSGSRRKGIMAIVPDRGLLNFWKPSSDMQRVRIEADPEFEKKFEIYSTDPLEAKQILFDSGLRALLLELRAAGKVFAYLGPDEAMIAATGKNRFEPGSMFRSRPGQERARLMFDDVCASLGVLKALKAKLA